MSDKEESNKLTERKPPVNLPLSFDDAVTGLLKVDRAQMPSKQQPEQAYQEDKKSSKPKK